MNTQTLRFATRVLALAAICLSAATLAAQTAPPVEIGPRVTIGFSNAPSVSEQGVNGHFRPAGVYANESVLLRLDYDPTFAGMPVIATPLDGGEVALPRLNPVVDKNGVTWIRFRAGKQPGLYRVLVLIGGNRSILRFWVDDPKTPAASPPAIRRGIKG